ncbi:DUF7344 domain-containing protein [Haladaptatus sp. NG-SE-30]
MTERESNRDESLSEVVSDSDSTPAVRTGVPEIRQGVLELEHVFTSLADSRRRYLLYSLGSENEWSLTEVATKVAAWEMDIPKGEVPQDEIEKTYASLYHVHVPKLVDEKVIEFDEANETIHPGEHTEQVVSALAGVGASLDADQETHARSEFDDEGN